MTRLTFLIIIFLCQNKVWAQQQLHGSWLSENLLTLTITKDKIHFGSNDSLTYRLSNDTIFATQRKIYTEINSKGERYNVDTTMLNLIVFTKETENKLQLQPINIESRIWLGDAKKLNGTSYPAKYFFLKEDIAKKTWLGRENIKLKKLAFRRTGGEMDLSNIKYEIYRNRKIYFYGKIDSNVHPNHLYNGFFTSKLSKENYKELLDLLTQSALNHISHDWQFITCGSLYQLSIEDENGFAKYSGGIIPKYSRKLVKHLDDLFKKLVWKKMDKPHHFKFLERKTKEEIKEENNLKMWEE